MTRLRKYLSIIVAFVMIGLLSAPVQSITAATTSYQASAGFTGTQGTNQWHYQYWNGSSYTNMTYDSPNSRWITSGTFSMVANNYMHGDTGKDGVRKWVAPAHGVVRIKGTVKKLSVAGGDGVNAKILHNSTLLFDQDIAYDDNVGFKHDMVRTVNSGEAIYFRINMKSNSTHDSTTWDPLIQFTPSTQSWEFATGAEGWTSVSGTSVSPSGGYLDVALTGAADPSIKSADNLILNVTHSAVLKIKFKNNTSDTNAKVYFTTTTDTGFDEWKVKSFNVNANDPNYTEYTVDMSGVYGWVGKLRQIRLDLSNGAATSGSWSIDYVRLEKGGTGLPGFTISDQDLLYSASTLTSKGLGGYPDDPLGVLKTGRDSYEFYGSNGGIKVGTETYREQSTVKTTGSLDDPANMVVYNSKVISGLPSDFQYGNISFVYKEPGTNNLLGFMHVERWPNPSGTPLAQYFYASIGLAVSTDHGATWTWCGELYNHDHPFSHSSTASKEVGAGSFLVDNGYFYIYTVDYVNGFVPGTDKAGLSVSRALVSDVLTAAKAATPGVTTWHKWHNGGWTEPALGGSFTSVIEDSHAWGPSMSYNSHLGKYVMVKPIWVSNAANGAKYTDLEVRTSSSLTDFKNTTSGVTVHSFDTGSEYVVYASAIGQGEDPQYQTGRSFYVYYLGVPDGSIQWGTDNSMKRRLITFD